MGSAQAAQDEPPTAQYRGSRAAAVFCVDTGGPFEHRFDPRQIVRAEAGAFRVG